MDLNIQFLSDTHIEMITEKYEEYKRNNILDNLWGTFVVIKGDIVILCGDIGNPRLESYWSFLSYIAKRCKKLLVITGNHEYWGSSIEETDALIREKIKEIKNASYLQRDFFVVDKTVILGCTLWSFIPQIFSAQIQNWSGDFRYIKGCCDTSTYTSWYTQNVNWLFANIKNFRRQGFQIVVATHHTPNFELNFNPRFDINLHIFNFASDLSPLFPYVSLWLYGHTHFDYNDRHIYSIPDHKIQFGSNQRGYPSTIKPNYSNCAMINILALIPSEMVTIIDTFSYDADYVAKIEAKVKKWIQNGKK